MRLDARAGAMALKSRKAFGGKTARLHTLNRLARCFYPPVPKVIQSYYFAIAKSKVTLL